MSCAGQGKTTTKTSPTRSNIGLILRRRHCNAETEFFSLGLICIGAQVRSQRMSSTTACPTCALRMRICRITLFTVMPRIKGGGVAEPVLHTSSSQPEEWVEDWRIRQWSFETRPIHLVDLESRTGFS